jgi:hypothetical protein
MRQTVSTRARSGKVNLFQSGKVNLFQSYFERV